MVAFPISVVYALLGYFEAVDFGNVFDGIGAAGRYGFGVRHEVEVREGCAEVRSVDVGLTGGLGVEEIVAFGAEDVDGVVAGEVGEAAGEDRLTLAEDPGAAPEGSELVFFVHGVHPAVGDDISGVD